MERLTPQSVCALLDVQDIETPIRTNSNVPPSILPGQTGDRSKWREDAPGRPVIEPGGIWRVWTLLLSTQG